MARTTKTKEDTATEPVEAPEATATETVARSPCLGSKLAMVIALFESQDGATISEIMTATNWQ